MGFDIPKYNTRLGTLRAYHLAGIVFISSFIAGYDSGVAGGILTFKPFETDFHYTAKQKTKVNSLTVGLGQLGSLCACFVIWPVTNLIGRKKSIMLGAIFFVVGVILQSINTSHLSAWYVARFVGGFGQGILSVVVPIYSSEMTPKEIRGRCGSFYQWLFTWGVLISYWVDYGVAEAKITTQREWQIPIALQLVSGGLLFLGTFSLPESVRWLLTKNRPEEALKALTWTRADESEKTIAEFNEIRLGLQAEALAKVDFSIRELWDPRNRIRFFLGSMLFMFQNCTGSSALAVFAPQFFALLVGSSGNTDLLLTGLFGAVKVVACSFFIWVLAERFGRRVLLTSGSGVMASCMLITALLDHFKRPPATGVVTASGKATVALIYINIMAYNCSWGPLPWAYVPEIFPTRVRALGMGVCIAVHWITSFVFSFSSPYMIAGIGWATFLLFACLDVCAGVFCFFMIKETRGKNLEVASGVQWQVAEKAHDGSREEMGERAVPGEVVVDEKTGDTVVVDEASGNEVALVAADIHWSRKD